jgi:hypothetical protein
LGLPWRPLHRSDTHHSFKEIDMTHARFSLRYLLIGLGLAAILVGIASTLVVVAQNPYASETDGESGDAPAKITVVEEVELLPGPADPNATAYFKFIGASAFTPIRSDMTYDYAGAGCIYRTGGTEFTDHTLQVPQGAVIDFLRVFFYDNDPVNDAEAIIWSFDGAGNSYRVTKVASAGTPGWSSAGTVEPFTYTVNNREETLILRLDYEAATSDNLQICGVRVRYQYDISATSLPVILNQTNP